MYESDEDEGPQSVSMLAGGSAGAAAIAMHGAQATSSTSRFSLGTLRDQLFARIETLDIAPDLGADIGSKRWFRGLGTFVGLSVVALVLTSGGLSTRNMVVVQAGEGFLGVVPNWNFIVTGFVPFAIFFSAT